MDFPMPQLKRSVAVFEQELQRTETIRPHRKASLSELEQMVKEFKNIRDYSSTTQALAKIDGLKPLKSHDEDTPLMFCPITKNKVEHELNYIYKHGIEKFITDYTHRSCEGMTCLRDSRYLNAQLLFLQETE